MAQVFGRYQSDSPAASVQFGSGAGGFPTIFRVYLLVDALPFALWALIARVDVMVVNDSEARDLCQAFKDLK